MQADILQARFTIQANMYNPVFKDWIICKETRAAVEFTNFGNGAVLPILIHPHRSKGPVPCENCTETGRAPGSYTETFSYSIEVGKEVLT